MSGTPRGLRIALLLVLVVGVCSYCVSNCRGGQERSVAKGVIENDLCSRYSGSRAFVGSEERSGLFREHTYRV